MAGTVAVTGLAGCTRSGAAATSDQSVTPRTSAQVSPLDGSPAAAPAGGAGEAAEAASVQAVADAADTLIARAEEAMAGDD